jgi:uncharacterized protein YcbK (DUF882 family)
MKHFKREEFACKHCGENEIDTHFLERLDRARDISGVPYIINSGYRCEVHNSNVGSTSRNHTSGKAADIKAINSYERMKIIYGLIMAGFTRIGVAKTFIHVDSMKDGVPVTACWFY